MRAIRDRFRQIERVKLRLGWDRFFSRAQQKTRDWHVLGAVQRLLLSAGLDAPEFATAGEGPDFQTHYRGGRVGGLVEVLEVLPPGHKRQESHRGMSHPVVTHFN